MYRKLLQEEMEKVERGEDPIGVIRDPEENRIIEFHTETEKGQFVGVKSPVERLKLGQSREQFNPKIDEIVALFEKASN
jgi:5,5'-dehydrodivanillate O-demethylase